MYINCDRCDCVQRARMKTFNVKLGGVSEYKKKERVDVSWFIDCGGKCIPFHPQTCVSMCTTAVRIWILIPSDPNGSQSLFHKILQSISDITVNVSNSSSTSEYHAVDNTTVLLPLDIKLLTYFVLYLLSR